LAYPCLGEAILGVEILGSEVRSTHFQGKHMGFELRSQVYYGYEQVLSYSLLPMAFPHRNIGYVGFTSHHPDASEANKALLVDGRWFGIYEVAGTKNLSYSE
jgi:hypothetical protein